MRYGLATLIGFACGFLCSTAITAFRDTDASRIRSHWRALSDYHAYTRDPQNLEPLGNGMSGFQNPPDPMPHLDALVRYGEVEYADLILPAAPNSRAAFEHWVMFTNKHNDILHSVGGTSYVAFNPSGEQPLHVKFWYRPSAEPKLQQLIEELESLPD